MQQCAEQHEVGDLFAEVEESETKSQRYMYNNMHAHTDTQETHTDQPVHTHTHTRAHMHTHALQFHRTHILCAASTVSGLCCTAFPSFLIASSMYTCNDPQKRAYTHSNC